MTSSSPVEARPVRTLANSRPSVSTAVDIRASRSFSNACMPLPSRRHDRAHWLAEHDPLDVTGARQVEHDDRQLVVHYREIAALSITWSPRFRALMYVMRASRSAPA